MTDVHTEHCCVIHGCKYGDEDCTVTTGELKQSYPCEFCKEMDKTIIDKMWSEKISYKEYCRATVKEIKKAYVWIRENNSTIPDDILDLMKDSSIRYIEGE